MKNRMRKGKKLLKFLSVVFACALMTTGNAFAAGRIIPSGKVTMYDGDKAVGQYSSEAPLPEDVTLVCSGKCAMETENLRMVAEDKTRFSFSAKEGGKVLQVKEGVLYFALSEMPRPITFATPYGDYTVQQIMINASAQGGVLQGYLKLDKESGELGVLGGNMVVSSAKGDRTIQDGKRILLAQSEVIGDSVGVGGGAGTSGGNEALGGILAGGIPLGVSGFAWAVHDNNDDDDPVSPSQPPASPSRQ